MSNVRSILLSGPRIIAPSCVLRPGCTAASRTATLSLSLTVAGSLAFVLVETPPPFVSQLNFTEVLHEAMQPDRLRPFMENATSAPHPTHHGVLDIPEPAATMQVPVVTTPGAQYQLLVAAQSAESAPCCFDRFSVQTFPISDSECRRHANDCCDPRTALADLRPAIQLAGSGAFPVCRDLQSGSGRSCKTLLPARVSTHVHGSFEQEVAFLGAPAGSVTATVTAGGQPLYDARDPVSRQPSSSVFAASKRAPASAALVAQQQVVFEGELIQGSARGGSIYLRCAPCPNAAQSWCAWSGARCLAHSIADC